MDEHKVPEVVAIMEDIRSRVTQDIQSHVAAAKGIGGQFGEGSQSGRSPTASGSVLTHSVLAHSEDLRAINLRHAFAANLTSESIKSHRPGLLGRIVVEVKRRCFNMLRDSLLRDYFSSELEFHSHLVRHLNALTREMEERAESVRRLEARVANLEIGTKR